MPEEKNETEGAIETTTEKGTKYELFVRGVIQRLYDQYPGLTVCVEHNKKIIGNSGQPHQLDIYWEYKLAGMTHKFAIDCKDYGSNIKKEKVQSVATIKADIPFLQFVLVTSKGFQSGAVVIAKAFGIGLKVIREGLPSDHDGRLNRIELKLNAIYRQPIEFKSELDRDWLQKQSDPQLLALKNGTALRVHGLSQVHDADAGSRRTIDQLFNETPCEVASSDVREHAFKWKNAYLEVDGIPPIKLNSLIFRYLVKQETRDVVLGSKVADAIVKDALTDNMLFIDEEGISGDVEEELGLKKK